MIIIIIIIIINNNNNNSNISIKHQMQHPTDDTTSSQTLTRKRPFQTTKKLVPLVFAQLRRSFSHELRLRFVQMMNNYGATVLVPEVDSDYGKLDLRKGLFFLHPGRLTWNLQITHLERKMIFQTSMIMVHVNLPGCNAR